MHELLWKAGESHIPLELADVYELKIEFPPNAWGPSYVVRRTRFEWDHAQAKMVPAEYIIDRVGTLEKARARYALHRQILGDLGFVHSETGPLF